MSKKKAQIKKLWKQGRNVWEIAQLTGIAESRVQKIVSEI
jgi:DNA-binding CsgD family transcriptional regulator